MSRPLNARIPLRIEQKLAEYCARQGVTRTDTVVRALDAYLATESAAGSAYALAQDLIPKRGAPSLQSEAARKLARRAFRGSRAR